MTHLTHSPIAKAVLRTFILFAALFAIGMITRMPAKALPQLYALHGVIAAPLSAALALWHFQRGGGIAPLVAATGLLAAVLGMMSPAMGASFALVAVLTLGLWAALGSLGTASRQLVVSIAFGALEYPCALAVGIMTGGYFFSLDAALTPVLLLLLSIALAGLGAWIVSLLTDRPSATPTEPSR